MAIKWKFVGVEVIEIYGIRFSHLFFHWNIFSKIKLVSDGKFSDIVSMEAAGNNYT